MPIYDYTCDSCNHRFEVRQGFHDDPLTECPECTGRIRRVLYPAGVIFKGSGWYSTDNRTNGGSSNGNPESSTTDAASSTSESSSTATSKPAASTSETSKPEKAAAED